jgi:hypothetical protein
LNDIDVENVTTGDMDKGSDDEGQQLSCVGLLVGALLARMIVSLFVVSKQVSE